MAEGGFQISIPGDEESHRWEYSNPCHLEVQEIMSDMQRAFRERDVDYIVSNLQPFRECVRMKCWKVYEMITSAFRCNLPDVVRAMHDEGLPVDLDSKLAWMVFENRVAMTELLCGLGAGAIRPFYWDYDEHDYRRMMETLMCHNLLKPTMSLSSIAPILGGRTGQVCVMLDLAKDFCKTVNIDVWDYVSFLRNNQDLGVASARVLALTELFWRNGATFLLLSFVLHRLPLAGPRVRKVLEVALSPCSLKSLCRRAFRDKMPRRYYKRRVGELSHLPSSLSKYLCSAE